MGLLKTFRDKVVGLRRRPEFYVDQATPGSGVPEGLSLLSPSGPRNRAERRFFEHKVRRLAGRIEMRARGRMQRRRRVARWQRRLMRDLSGHHWGDKRGRVMPRG